MSTGRDDNVKRDVRLNVRVPEELLEQLREAAKAENVTMSGYIKRLLTLATQGRLREEPR